MKQIQIQQILKKSIVFNRWCWLLFFSQLAHIIAIVSVFVVFFAQIMNHANVLLEKLYSITPEQISANAIDNPLALYAHYNSLVSLALWLIVLSCLIYLVLNGISWSSANKIINKGKFFSFFPSYIVLSLIFAIPLLFIAWKFLGLVMVISNINLILVLMGVIVLIFLYFMGISFGLIHKYKLKEIKKHLIETFKTGVFKSYVLAPIGIFIAVISGISVWLIYLSQDSILFLAITIVLFVSVLAYSKMLYFSAVREVSKGRIVKKKIRK